MWTRFNWLKIGTTVRCYEHSNEPSGSDGEFVYKLSDYEVPKCIAE
jgi:hypothetical protein